MVSDRDSQTTDSRRGRVRDDMTMRTFHVGNATVDQSFGAVHFGIFGARHMIDATVNHFVILISPV